MPDGDAGLPVDEEDDGEVEDETGCLLLGSLRSDSECVEELKVRVLMLPVVVLAGVLSAVSGLLLVLVALARIEDADVDVGMTEGYLDEEDAVAVPVAAPVAGV